MAPDKEASPTAPAAAAEDHRSVLASPACFAAEMEDGYMGFATREELLSSFNELLEAERAGAKVALRSAAEAPDPETKALLEAIQRDEAHWCAMLNRAIRALDGTPSPLTGAFYEKAMAIASLPDRLAFLNRGQGWVVRRLRELLPRTRDDVLHAALTEMLTSHERNIDRVEPHLPPPRR